MGFNIAGIVINKNYDNKIEELGNSLGLKLTFEKEVSYEEASSNWKDDGVCDIYFAENGTFLYLSMERCGMPCKIENQNVLSFCYSETSMAFSLNYCEGFKLQRSIMDFDGDIKRQSGNPLPEEATNSETSELIFAKIADVLGQKFWDIDFASKAFRYKFDSLKY